MNNVYLILKLCAYDLIITKNIPFYDIYYY